MLTQNQLVKKAFSFSLLLLLGALFVLGLLQLDPVSQLVTPKRYWRKKIFSYQKEFNRAKKTQLIKQIQLKKKVMTGELDVAQDVILGIDRGISVSVVMAEIEKLKESVADSEKAVHDLEAELAEAKERFNSK